MKLHIVYDRRYNLGFPGAQRLHPFDLRKYARAWRLLKDQLGRRLAELHLPVTAPVSDEVLRLVHSQVYLQSLKSSAVVAQAIETPALRRAPYWLLDRFLLQPMRWAAAGSIAAARAALDCGLAFNLVGGFHHAKPDRGEGFSIFNDIALAVGTLTREGRLTASSRVAYVDLDAHMGNGVAWCFREDSRVFFFDMHNQAIYPVLDLRARERIDCPIGLAPGTLGEQYLAQLRSRLPPFLDSVGRSAPISLAIYNAGTDVLAGDPLGGLSLTPDDVLRRDQFVLNTLRQRGIPTVMLTSGGYTDESHRAIARTIAAAAMA